MPEKMKIHHRIKKGLSKFAAKLTGKRKDKSKKKEVSTDFPLVEKRARAKVLAALSYLHVLVVLPLIFGRKNNFVHFHAKQGVTILGLWVIDLFLFYIPILAWVVFFILIVETVLGIVIVILGKEKPLPLIGKMAANFKI